MFSLLRRQRCPLRFACCYQLSGLRFSSGNAINSNDTNAEDDGLLLSEENLPPILNLKILAAGNCVARHKRPIPESLNLDELSEFLLSKQEQQVEKSSTLKNQQQLLQQKHSPSFLVSNIKRIIPPNAKTAAVVTSPPGSSSSTAGSSMLQRMSGKQQQILANSSKRVKDQHSQDNLLLFRIVPFTLTDNNNNKRKRDVVVFPDSTIVAWGEDCSPSDCDAIAQFLFSQLRQKAASESNIASSVESVTLAPNVETESIHYQFVVVEDDGASQTHVSSTNATTASSSSATTNDDVNNNNNNNETATFSPNPGTIEMKNGVALIYGPFADEKSTNNSSNSKSESFISNYNCYPAEVVVGKKMTEKINSAVLDNEDQIMTLQMLPIVMATAQSARVDAIDNFVVSKLARDVRLWQRDLAFKGIMGQRFTRSDLRKSKAILLGVMEEVSFALDLEATPKLLRISGELERFREWYDIVGDHFELEQRLEALHSRVEALDHSLVYLTEERHAVVSEQMTIFIAILIFLEIVVGLVHHYHDA